MMIKLVGPWLRFVKDTKPEAQIYPSAHKTDSSYVSNEIGLPSLRLRLFSELLTDRVYNSRSRPQKRSTSFPPP